MILSIDIERKPYNILSYLLVKTLYPPKVPQATENFILPDRVSKACVKDRLVAKRVTYILCKEKLVLNSYVFDVCLLLKIVLSMITKIISMLNRWFTLLWPLLLAANTNCLPKCFIQIFFPTYNFARPSDVKILQSDTGVIFVVGCDEQDW